MAQVLGYHHLSLSVTDLGKSTEWYQQVLGLDLAAEIEGDGFRRTRLRAPNSGVTLTLTRHDQQSGETFSERRPGMDHVALHVGAADDVRALKDRFAQLGVQHSEVKAANDETAVITLRDPDNIQIEVFGGPLDPAIAEGVTIASPVPAGPPPCWPGGACSPPRSGSGPSPRASRDSGRRSSSPPTTSTRSRSRRQP